MDSGNSLLRKFTLGNNGVEPTYEIMIEPLP